MLLSLPSEWLIIVPRLRLLVDLKYESIRKERNRTKFNSLMDAGAMASPRGFGKSKRVPVFVSYLNTAGNSLKKYFVYISAELIELLLRGGRRAE